MSEFGVRDCSVILKRVHEDNLSEPAISIKQEQTTIEQNPSTIFDEARNIKHEKSVQYVLLLPTKSENTFEHEECLVKTSSEAQPSSSTRPHGKTVKIRDTCKLCSLKFKNEKMLRIHKKEKHFICPKCHFPSKNLICHEKHTCLKSSLRKSFKCDWCNKEFGSLGNLKQHIQIHAEDLKQACKFCGKKVVKNRLPQHIRLVHCKTQSTAAACDYCPYTCPYKQQLEFHLKVHFKPFECDICKKKFSEQRYFEEHKLNHVKPNPFACEKCSNAYTRKTSLSRHNRTAHSDSRNYACKECSYKGKTKDDLTTHFKTHTRAYKCDVCRRNFARSSLLKEHRILHDNPNAYQCKVCNSKFAQKKTLKIHLNTHIHDETTD